MQTDENLAALAVSDQNAFQTLMERYQRQVYTIALRHAGRPDDAFDISQEIFIKLWRGLPSFRGESAFSTWLYRLAHNVCMDYLRRQKNRRELSLDASPDATAWIPDERYDPVRRQEQRQLGEDINAALEHLQSEHRSILLLREVAGLSYTEIAAALDLEEGTVKSRLFRARTSLREKLEEMWNESRTAPSKQSKKQKQDGKGKGVRGA